VGAEIARLEQSIQHRKDLMQRQSEDLRATGEQIAEIRSHIENDRVELEELDRVLSELGPGLEQAYAAQRASQEALTLAERAMEEWRHSWQQLGDELAASERAEHVEATRLEQLAGQEQRLEKELAKNVEERSALTFAALEERLETLAAEEARLSTAAEEATRGLADVWQ